MHNKNTFRIINKRTYIIKQPNEKNRMSPVCESFPSLEFNKLGCYICIFFVWMCLYMLNLDEIDILYLVNYFVSLSE